MTPFLLDTHTVLWAMFEPIKLSEPVNRLLADPESVLVVSICSLWEMTIKASLGKMVIPGGDINAILENLDAFRIQILQIRPEHLHILQNLPYHHRDPFDRMIIAQSLLEGLPLVSKDADIQRYALTTVW